MVDVVKSVEAGDGNLDVGSCEAVVMVIDVRSVEAGDST